MRSLVFILLLCCGPVLAAHRKLPDQIIETPVGTFRVTNLSCEHGIGFLFVDGSIVNETSKPWDTVWLAMDFQDKNGVVKPKALPSPTIIAAHPSASAGLVAHNVGKGQTIKLRYQESVKADKSTFSVVFTFADGRYPVNYRLALTKPVPSDTLVFRDDALAVAFSPERTELGFTLQNNSDEPIKIDWNLVAFVESWGTSQAVVHKGVKFVDKESTKAPSVIPPKAKIEDMVVPVDRIELVESNWLTHSLFIEGPASLKMVGQEFSVFMPLVIGTATKNYSFTFRIVGVD